MNGGIRVRSGGIRVQASVILGLVLVWMLALAGCSGVATRAVPLEDAATQPTVGEPAAAQTTSAQVTTAQATTAHPTIGDPTMGEPTVVEPAAGTEGATPDAPASVREPASNQVADAASRLGVQIFEADVGAGSLPTLAQTGIGWVRTRALWKLIESAPGRYDWSATDPFVVEPGRLGLKNVMAVYANPPWAAPTECGPVDPSQMPRYTALWRALVERYDGDGQDDVPGSHRVHLWQVSNEADFDPTAAGGESDYGGCFGHRPDAYAAHVAAAIRAAKAADPRAEVLFGPVAYDRFTDAAAPDGWVADPGPFAFRFVPEAVAALPADVAPAGFAVHNYNDHARFWDFEARVAEAPSGGGLDAEPSAAGPVTRYRELVAKAWTLRHQVLPQSLAEQRLTVSETGLAASPSDPHTERSEAWQAIYVAQTFTRGLAAGADPVIWYTARDNLWGVCGDPSAWMTFGLMRSDGFAAALADCPEAHPGDYAVTGRHTPRPALDALATAVAMFDGAHFAGIVPVAAGDAGASRGLPRSIEAYAFARGPGADALGDGRAESMIVAWADNSRRLGARGVQEATARLALGDLFESGPIAATGHLGQDIGPLEPSDVLTLSHAPVYLRGVAP